jgi:hypothetical protein
MTTFSRPLVNFVVILGSLALIWLVLEKVWAYGFSAAAVLCNG